MNLTGFWDLFWSDLIHDDFFKYREKIKLKIKERRREKGSKKPLILYSFPQIPALMLSIFPMTLMFIEHIWHAKAQGSPAPVELNSLLWH